MILKNPTKNDVSIGYKGSEYLIRAEDTLLVSDELGSQWKRIHGFLEEVDALASTMNISNTDSDTTIVVDLSDADTTETKPKKEVKVTKETEPKK